MQPDTPLATRVHESSNAEARRAGANIDCVILHYTGTASVEAAISLLASPEAEVSCHYVIDDGGVIIQMVPENLRAWHAGVSWWRGVDDINSCSIGIEIQNVGHRGGYPGFPAVQMEGVIALCRDLSGRYRIQPQRFLAHSDVAPRRKIDPGEKFDWPLLASAGVGHWVPPVPVGKDARLSLHDRGNAVIRLQRQLRAYGYGIDATGLYDEHTLLVVTAFQRHFRPVLVDGAADASVIETLDTLLEAMPPRAWPDVV